MFTDLSLLEYTLRSLDNMAHFLQNTHERHTIVRPISGAMACLSWFRSMLYVEPLQWPRYMQYPIVISRTTNVTLCIGISEDTLMLKTSLRCSWPIAMEFEWWMYKGSEPVYGNTNIKYIPQNMHTIHTLLCFCVLNYWYTSYQCHSGLLHWYGSNHTVAPVPME